MRSLAILVLALAALPAAAQTIYRHVDAQGNVTFTDAPPGDEAQPLTLPPVNTVPAHRPPAAQPGQPAAQARVPYSEILLYGVDNGVTLHNPEQGVTITAKFTPSLQQGDRITLFLNGKALDLKGSSALQIPQLDRGTYRIEAQISDAQGKVVATAAPLEFYVQRTSVAR